MAEHADGVAAAAEHNEAHGHGDMDVQAIFGYLVALTAASFATLIVQGDPTLGNLAISFGLKEFGEALKGGLGLWGPVTNVLFVLLVGVCKASLVVAFFMHLKYEKEWKYVLCVPPLVLGAILILVLLPDVAFPTWPRVPFTPH